ncbi:cobalamin biosynthesis protein CobW [Agrobacterium rubi]|uniref:Cobalamin biosynthesis protein CobW n=1 Tax=Agrobacterium rubi TaxID=28099 RepID=A0AAE7UP23_9HYPH|nr:cobalamin biosynthesis protein CobW [Agrobacterium rubi]NTE87577.1 cobalamin biosynthesis protein CobW [Agrobacterium rubi]NTF03431.1 cobalamin biosynthesis protein CobW [Agrobacterium rubi]NTF37591.1 cobalamin biosynthesis protein CobW [Agrobacterium rubi]OCJ45803.1 cobalamin biosynthesis protein CobW [Agrobacterium rubi]QTG01583.1 cobalamin biosynthesis protein CobW [Agrobacterium rubi]
MMTTLNRVPCTIITGFLGAGKTTLLRGLLEKLEGKRLAIIVNEFGDVGIDGDILKGCGIESCPEENIVELANGCICCTVADDFQPAIEQILSREPRVEHILIETSGLALPKPLVQAFQWPAIKSRVTVDAVVAVADGVALAEGMVSHDLEALAAQRQNDEALDHDDPVEEVFEDQIACADLIVLTKGDLLDAAGLERAKAHINAHLPKAAKIVVASNGVVDPAVLIGLGLAVEEDIENRHTHHDEEEDHDHDEFDSFVVELDAVTDADALAARISETAASENVLRIKGFVEVSAKPMRLQVQAVGSRVNHYFDRPWAAGEVRRSRLVVIGEKGLDRAKIERMLAA